MFLTQLKHNNNRPWFLEHKSTFKTHEHEVKTFFSEVESDLKQTDDIESSKVYRIYRDIRFSKDKTPYKSRFSGGFSRTKPALRGWYWLNIEPGNCAAGGGFYGPNASDLLRIRKEFEIDDSEIRAILSDYSFKTMFGGKLLGEELKTAPRGFSKTHHALDLIRKKQFYAVRNFSDKEVTSSNFKDELIKTYTALRPYFNYMSDVLTTDLNGESII